MSNQRFGKTHKASGFDNGAGMKLLQFFKYARIECEDADRKEAAFYFGQIEDHLRSGKGLPSEQNSIMKVLGL
tara:strand:- start:13202 stop:13420 length:219 start_codon:yes stop_codon:yes gene_type:complete